MTTENDKDLEIILEDEVEKKETGKEPEIEVKTAEESEKELSPEKGIDELNAAIEFSNKQLEEQKLARAAAEQRAREAEQRETHLHKSVKEANVQTLSSAIETLKSNGLSLKQQYRSAVEAGDFDLQADLMEQMTTNSAKMIQLESARTREQDRPLQTQPPSKDALLENAVKNLTPASGAWLRRNPDVIASEDTWRKAQAAHSLAVLDGIQVDTPEYFDYLEGKLGIGKKPDPKVETRKEEPSVSAKNPPVAAPVSRGNESGTTRRVGNTANRVTLSAAEVAMAKELGMTTQDYAKNKLLLQKEDRYKANA